MEIINIISIIHIISKGVFHYFTINIIYTGSYYVPVCVS